MPDNPQLEADRQVILDAKAKGTGATLLAYSKLSGPGWLQSALTLGGGSLGSSLYLGILAGVSMIWLQPFAMILGVIMLSAISYVSLSTNERPFQAINKHINPVLGWSWLIAALMANMVWSMPQYSLCFGVLEQNMLPDLVTDSNASKWTVSALILIFCTAITWSYGSGNIGVKIYEAALKVVVAVIVLCFMGVVIRMAMIGNGIDWAGIFNGLIPKFHHLFKPAATFNPLLNEIADPAARTFWSEYIVNQQRDVMISAGAAAVGINMTFLLPYNLLSRGWNKDFRGLTCFDLSTGMFIPFVLATGCIVVAAATQFHAQVPANWEVTASEVKPPEGELKRYEINLIDNYQKLVSTRNKAAEAEGSAITGEATVAEQKMAAVLAKRDTGSLANSLQQLFATEESDGRFFSNIVFGLGVVAMTLSSISLMMLISGFVICELVGAEARGWLFRIGCLASANGVLWPWIWDGEAKAWLTIVAGVFGAMLLPIAYTTFYLMINQKSLMGDERPRGVARLVWNVLMAIAVIAATAAGISAVYKKGGAMGLGFVAAYILLVIVVQISRKPQPAAESTA